MELCWICRIVWDWRWQESESCWRKLFVASYLYKSSAVIPLCRKLLTEIGDLVEIYWYQSQGQSVVDQTWIITESPHSVPTHRKKLTVRRTNMTGDSDRWQVKSNHKNYHSSPWLCPSLIILCCGDWPPALLSSRLESSRESKRRLTYCGAPDGRRDWAGPGQAPRHVRITTQQSPVFISTLTGRAAWGCSLLSLSLGSTWRETEARTGPVSGLHCPGPASTNNQYWRPARH